MAGNDAEGKQPTVMEEMAKFQGFSVKDGETADGKPSAEEQAAAAANSSTHAENVARAAGKDQTAEKTADKPGDKEGAKGGEAKEQELTVAEENAAIAAAAAAAGKKPEELDEAAQEKACADALATKKTDAAKAAKKHSAQQRIADITRARRTAERENAKKDARIAVLEAEMAALKSGKPVTDLTGGAKDAKTHTSGKPDHTDSKYEYGAFDEEYLADLAEWSALEAVRKAREGEKKSADRQAEADAKAAFDAKVTEFDESGLSQFDDFEAVVIESRSLDADDPAYWPLSPTMGELLLESEHGPAIAYELASNPKEARRLVLLSQARQAAWFGLKEAELIAGSGASQQDEGKNGAATDRVTPAKKPAAQESKAPVPLRSARKLNGSGGNQVPNSATSDFAAFEAQAMGHRRT